MLYDFPIETHPQRRSTSLWSDYQQPNRITEGAVNQMKNFIAGLNIRGTFDAGKFGKGLLLYRNAPYSGCRSKY